MVFVINFKSLRVGGQSTGLSDWVVNLLPHLILLPHPILLPLLIGCSVHTCQLVGWKRCDWVFSSYVSAGGLEALGPRPHVQQVEPGQHPLQRAPAAVLLAPEPLESGHLFRGYRLGFGV